MQEQQLLLTGASASLLATMDHLAVANLLNGESDKAAMVRTFSFLWHDVLIVPFSIFSRLLIDVWTNL